MMSYSTEPRFRKYVKDYGFLSFAKKLLQKLLLKKLYKKLPKATGT